jgi:hypothetical protein
MFYFGCWEKDRPGHYLFGAGGRHPSDGECPFDPWSGGDKQIDGGYCPPNRQVEGAAALTLKDGWTILAFWDRSVDHRPNSNSAFIEKGMLTFDDMVAQARAEFPEIWGRFAFEVRPAEGT